MGDRYYLSVKCKKCDFVEEDVWYAPTCGVITTKCPKCNHQTNLEEYSGINAESCANTEYGLKAVKDLKQKT